MINYFKGLEVRRLYEISLIAILKFIYEYFYYIISIKVNIDNLIEFNFDFVRYSYGWILALSIYIILIYKRDLKVFIIFLFIYILYILPNIVYFSFKYLKIEHLMYILIPYVFILIFTKNYKVNRIINVNSKKVLIFSIVMVFVSLIHLIYSTNGNFIIDFKKVYDFRLKYDDLSNQGIWAYLNNWAYKIFVLFIISYSLFKKNWYLLLFSIFSIVLFYSFTGHKITFLSFFIVLFIYIIYKLNWNRIVVIVGTILFFISILIFNILTNDIWVTSILVRRFLFVPAILNFTYFDFFMNNEFIYWSNGMLKSFFVYPYDKSFTLIIGEVLKTGSSANTGFIATAFAHAGFVGIIFYTLIATVILNIVNNSIFNENEKFIKISISFLPIYIFFTSSDLLTTIFTHGLFIVILILIILNIKSEKI